MTSRDDAHATVGDRKSSDVAIVVVSCDKYADLWPAFFLTFFRYWSDCPYEIYLGSGKLMYPDARVHPLLVGEDVSYSDSLRAMLEKLPQEWVIFWVEDRLVAGEVNTVEVMQLVARAKAASAGYLKLLAEHPFAYGLKSRGCGEIPRGTPYRISLTVALWYKAHLLGLLRPGETAWELEENGSARSDILSLPHWALAPACRERPPIPFVHTIIRGRVAWAARAFIRREGLGEYFTKRRPQSPASALYTFLYFAFFGLINPCRDIVLRRKDPPKLASGAG